MVYGSHMKKSDLKMIRGNRRAALIALGIDPRGPRAQRIPDKRKKASKDACRGKVRF